ncbi:MAG TPA: SAF domain-containing protein [Candidatus Melainabacteria bacterium]|nr:SAF domain-containing protein [Candidatus Melainabacteria bacterium]
MKQPAILIILALCANALFCYRYLHSAPEKYQAVFAIRDIPFGKVISTEDVEVFAFQNGYPSIEMVGYQTDLESVVGQVAERDIQEGQEIIKLRWHKGMTGSFFAHGALKWNIKQLRALSQEPKSDEVTDYWQNALYCLAWLTSDRNRNKGSD